MASNKQKYDAEYRKQYFDQMYFVLPKGKRELVKKIAKERGITVTKLIVDALETMYHIDLSK